MESKLRGLFRRTQGKSLLPGRKSFAPPSSEFLPPLPPAKGTKDKLEESLRIGDHVCISGVKTGHLLYFGKFLLAEGVWCGIELDEHVGKHDGEVQGVRYFTCKPGHGIFAPVEKVTLVSPQSSAEKKGLLNEPGRAIRSKLQRRTIAAPQTYSQLSRESSSEKGSVESLSSQSDTGSETSLQRCKTSGGNPQIKKSRLSFLKKPSAIPKSGGPISSLEAGDLNQRPVQESNSGLQKPQSIGGKSKLQKFKGKSNPYPQKVLSYQNNEQALNTTQTLPQEASYQKKEQSLNTTQTFQKEASYQKKEQSLNSTQTYPQEASYQKKEQSLNITQTFQQEASYQKKEQSLNTTQTYPQEASYQKKEQALNTTQTFQQEASFQKKEQALNSTQIIETSSPQLNNTHNLEDGSKASVVSNQTLLIASVNNVSYVLGSPVDTGTPTGLCRSIEKRSQPDDKSTSEQDFKRARISQLPLSKHSNSGMGSNEDSGNQQISKLNGTFTAEPPNKTILVDRQSDNANGTFNVPDETDCTDDQQAFSPEVHRQLVAGGKHYLNFTFGADQQGPFIQDDVTTSPTYSGKSDECVEEELCELDSRLDFLKGDCHIGEATRLGILKPEEMEDTHLISASMLESAKSFSIAEAVELENQRKNVTFDSSGIKVFEKQKGATSQISLEFDSKDYASLGEASSIGLLKGNYSSLANNSNFLAENPRLQEIRRGENVRLRGRNVIMSTGSDLEEEMILAEGSLRNRISSVESDNFALSSEVITSTPLLTAAKEVCSTNVSIGKPVNLEEIRMNLDFTNNACPEAKEKPECENQEINQQIVPMGNIGIKNIQGQDLTDAILNSAALQSSSAKPEGGHNEQNKCDMVCTNLVESTNKMSNEMQTSFEFPKTNSKPMTDSGIDNVMMSSQEMCASVEGQTAISRSGSSVDKLDQILAQQNQLTSDLLAGHTKTDRPLSLISSISSVDTGYVPDTDSERGTLTTNSPSEWLEKQGELHPVHNQKTLTEIYTETFHPQQEGMLRGSGWRGCVDSAMETDNRETTEQSHIEEREMEVGSNTGNDTMETWNDGENSETESSNDVTEIMVSKPIAENTMCVGKSSDETQDMGASSRDTMTCMVSDQHDHNSEKENLRTVQEQEMRDISSEADKSTDKSKSKGKASKSFTKLDHKKPNVNVGSKLAEYLNSSLPSKAKEEGSASVSKAKKNLSNKTKANSSLNKTNTPAKEDEETKPRRERVQIVKELPKIIKRTTPKSKWGDIMGSIEARKDTPPKPKERPKSQLEAIFSQPPPTKSEIKKPDPKPKKKLMSLPKPDYSSVKSRLNTGAPKSNLVTPRSRTDSNSSLGAVLHLDLSSSVNGSFNDSVKSACSSRSDLSGHGDGSRRRKHSGKASSLKRPDEPLSVRSIKLEDVSTNSIKAMNEKNVQKSPRRKAEIKSSIPPIAPLPRRSRSSPAQTSGKTTEPSTSKQTSKPTTAVTKRSSSASSYQNRNKSIKSKTTSNLKSSENEQKVKAAEEISRLEALCESRTKEVTLLKMQLKSGITAFDAMSALVNYLTQELDAFSCPVIKGKLEKVQAQLSDTQKQLGCLEELKKALEEEKVLQEAKIHKLEQGHSNDIDNLRGYHDRHIKEINFEYEEQTQLLKLSNKEEIQTLQCKHDNQMEELHRQHKDSREDITKRFESIKTSLLEKLETLKQECDELKKRARLSEEALLRDSDFKVQTALLPYKDLPQEIESLKLVIDMRNEEIRDLRRQNIEADIQLKQLPEAKERIICLEQKVENLEAIISMKTDHEKQLSDKCQRLLKKCDQGSKQNKRLSMNVDELMWKMTESGSDFGSAESLTYKRQLSHSPPSSDPDRRLHSSSSTDTSYSPGVLRRSGCQTVVRPVKRRSYHSGENPPSPLLSVMSKSFNESSLLHSSSIESSFSEGPHSLPPPPEPQDKLNGLEKGESQSMTSVEMKENGANGEQG